LGFTTIGNSPSPGVAGCSDFWASQQGFSVQNVHQWKKGCLSIGKDWGNDSSNMEATSYRRKMVQAPRAGNSPTALGLTHGWSYSKLNSWHVLLRHHVWWPAPHPASIPGPVNKLTGVKGGEAVAGVLAALCASLDVLLARGNHSATTGFPVFVEAGWGSSRPGPKPRAAASAGDTPADFALMATVSLRAPVEGNCGGSTTKQPKLMALANSRQLRWLWRLRQADPAPAGAGGPGSTRAATVAPVRRRES